MNSPWGKADHVVQIKRGVRWVSSPSHGGLAVAKGVAEAELSSAARACGEYWNGYYWYEEDCQCAVAFYEQPEWALKSGSNADKSYYEKQVHAYNPKYFELLASGVELPGLKVGMELKFLRDAQFGFGGVNKFQKGDKVRVVRMSSSSMLFASDKYGAMQFQAPLGYYYGQGYSSVKSFEAA
jgi:hypothetical protein